MTTIRRALLKRAYNALARPHTPRTIGVYAGVPARSARLLDATKIHPDYKRGLVDAIESEVDDGDTVCLIGFGRGISTVYALRAGADRVVAFEGSREMIQRGRETLQMQGLGKRVEVHHAIVGEAIDVYGSGAGAQIVSPAELPECDVLVLDCEGAELSILGGMTSAPETVIVETHPRKGAPAAAARDVLEPYESVEAREYPAAEDGSVALVATEPTAVPDGGKPTDAYELGKRLDTTNECPVCGTTSTTPYAGTKYRCKNPGCEKPVFDSVQRPNPSKLQL